MDRGQPLPAAVPFCEPDTRRSNYVDNPEGHLVELAGRVFRTCNRASAEQSGFLVTANPDALPDLRFPYTLLTLHVASPYSPMVPSGEWSAFMRHIMRLAEGGRLERRPDRVLGETVYEEYLRFGFTPDGTLIPASVYFVPAVERETPDHFVECRGPAVGLHGDASHCTMWLRYKGLNADIWFAQTEHALPDPIPFEQFEAYAEDVRYALSKADVTESVDEVMHLDRVVLESRRVQSSPDE